MLISRRAAIKGMLVTTVGAVTGAATYGVAFERHQIGVTHTPRSRSRGCRRHSRAFESGS